MPMRSSRRGIPVKNLMRLTIAVALGAFACALGAAVGLMWPGHPRWWMPTFVAGAEGFAALTALVALLGRSRERTN